MKYNRNQFYKKFILCFCVFISLTSCDKTEVLPADKLTSLEVEFLSTIKYTMAVEIPEGTMLDSLLCNEGLTGGNIGLKYDSIKSTSDTIVIRSTCSSSNNIPQGYGISKYYKVADGISVKNYSSEKGIYNDSKAVLRNITLFTKDGTKIIQSINGTKAYSYSYMGAGKSYVQSLEYPAVNAINTKLFSLYILR